MQSDAVNLSRPVEQEEKREPWALCMGGCLRELGDEDEVSSRRTPYH